MKIAALLMMALMPQDAEFDSVRNKLESMKISVDFQDIPITDAVDFIRETTSLNIVLDNKIAGDESTTVSLKVKSLSVKSILKLLVQTVGLSAMHKEGVIYIAPKAEHRSKMTTKIHDVRDLLLVIEDFPGPKVELRYDQPGIVIG